MHCTDASCEKVCPTGAISHNGEVVIIDQDWCIGCGYCVQACPYGVPHKDEEGEGTARKCRFCIDRITNGMEPACAKTCPTNTIQFGERDELIAMGKQRVQSLKSMGYPNANLYGENELGGLHTLYVLTESPSEMGLPDDPVLATNTTWAQWLSGAVAAGVVAAVPLWLLFKRKQKVQGGA
jgi:formate dehydrogenase iron-sulfur subunit